MIAQDIDALIKRYPSLSSLRGPLIKAAELLIRSIQNKGKILVAGNGGSAADADHIVGELQKSFAFKRPIAQADINAFRQIYAEPIASELGQRLEGGIRAMNLGNSAAFLSAFSNDSNYEYAFAQALYVWGDQPDVFIAISTSGNSKNILQAARVAKMKKIPVLALTGQTGGNLAEYADILINVPATLTHEIQELHLPIYHALCFMLEKHFFSKNYTLDSDSSQGLPRLEEDRKAVRVFDRIDLLVFDFDGVFTDNRVLTMQDGSEGVFCSRSDGLGIDLLRKAGIKMTILSKETNPVVKARAQKLNIPCFFGCDDKVNFLREHFVSNQIDPRFVVYMGNDINDLEAMQWVGTSIAPGDSHPEVKKIASLLLKNHGGQGAIRELAELIITTPNDRRP